MTERGKRPVAQRGERPNRNPAPSGVAVPADDPTPQPAAALTDLERRGILILDRPAVLKYLRSYPELLPAVERVSAAALEQLGDRAELSLEIYRDPEIDDAHLALSARQSPNQPDLFDTILRVMDEHWSLLPGTSGFFYLTTDFQRPRRLRHGV